MRSCRDREAWPKEMSFEEAVPPAALTPSATLAARPAALLIRRVAKAFAGVLLPEEVRVKRCRIADFRVPISLARPLALAVTGSPAAGNGVVVRVRVIAETLATGESVIVVDGELEMVPVSPGTGKEHRP